MTYFCQIIKHPCTFLSRFPRDQKNWQLDTNPSQLYTLLGKQETSTSFLINSSLDSSNDRSIKVLKQERLLTNNTDTA